jgi:hypothetical protein
MDHIRTIDEKKHGKCPKKHRGAHNELLACAFLLNEGYEVFRNVSPCGWADLIAYKEGKFLRIDVKGARNIKGLELRQKRDGVTGLVVKDDGTCEFHFYRPHRGELPSEFWRDAEQFKIHNMK